MNYQVDMNRFCEECDGKKEHEIWCSLNTESLEHEELQQSWWRAIVEQDGRLGRRAFHRFFLSPSATQEFAERYVATHPAEFSFDPIACVEKE